MEQVKEPMKEEREHALAIACRIMAGISPVSLTNSHTQHPFPTPSPFSFSGSSTRQTYRPSLHHSNLFLRFLVLLFSFISALALATSSTKNNRQRSPSFTEYPELIYCFSVAILAFFYAAFQLFKGISDIAHRGILISDMTSDYLSFVSDQLVGYLLISSASVAISILRWQVGQSTPLWKGTVISTTLSFATFLVIAISALLSGYKLCKRLVCEGLDSKRISITVILGHPGLLNQYRLLTRNKAGEMDDRLANIEKAFEDIKSDIEKKMERAQQSTQDYIAQSQADFLAKVAEMLTGNDPKKGKRLVIDPSALQKTEGPSDKTHLVASSSIEKQQSPQFGSSSFQRFDIQNNPGEYTVANEASKVETEMYKRLEDLDHRLEEKFKTAEGPDARELSLVPNLVLPMKFKMPEFEKFDGTSSPAVHLTMFCRRMTGHVDNDELLIHCFQDSLKGAAARWYNQLTRDKIRSWKDLAKAFIEQYKHITDIEPDRITLQNMEMRPNESFRQYVQRWRDVAAHVQPPLLEKEIAPTFVRTLKEPFLNYMLGNATKNFEDLVISGELIEQAIREGKIRDPSETLVEVEHQSEVHMVGSYPPYRTQSSRQSNYSLRPTSTQKVLHSVPVTYTELLSMLVEKNLLAPVQSKPKEPPYPAGYDVNAICGYHLGDTGHTTENCGALRNKVQKLIENGTLKFNHGVPEIN